MNKNKQRTITSGFDVIVGGATVDLFGVTDCVHCNATGQVDTTPKGATYERLEDCDACNGLGAR